MQSMPAVVANLRTGPVDVGPIQVGPFFTYELEEPIAPILRRLRDLGELARRQSSVWIECAASFSGTAPDLELGAGAVLELAQLRAGLTVALTYRAGRGAEETPTTIDALDVQVFIRLTGAFDPGDVTRRLGVFPTRTWRTGDPIGSGRARARSDNWEIAGNKGKDLNIQLGELRSAVGAKAASFRTNARHQVADARVEITWRYRPGTTRITLEPPDIAFAAQLGALIELDPIAG